MISCSLRCSRGRAGIWGFYAITVENVEVADRIRDELFAAFQALANTPGMGHYCNDLASKPLRFRRVREYLIVYSGEKRPIKIVRVLHGKRDVQALLA